MKMEYLGAGIKTGGAATGMIGTGMVIAGNIISLFYFQIKS